ncbi:MAG: polysaccharide deacetylase family protein [Ginsengibacter sp.]
MLLIYLPVITPRSDYIFEFIFNQQLGMGFRTTADAHAFINYPGEKINYSGHRFNAEFFIKASPLLAEDSIKKIVIPIEECNEIKILFPNNDNCDMGFDIFSATFYMLSRYEEYLPFIPDQYGRFDVTGSIAYKNNFLQMPVVDKWMEQFKIILNKSFPELTCKAAKFTALVTYDIDVAYKFKGRGFVRNTGSTIKDLLRFDFKNIFGRTQTLNNKNKDPWDTYDYLEKIIAKNNLQSVFFFLLGDHSMHDRNLDYKTAVMKTLVNKIKAFSEIGIHPSFTSSIFPKKITIEKERLEKISGAPITKSRQHFLKFILPSTYNTLVDNGIKEDYSMVFPYEAGFRAGTSNPFYFYDLKKEKTTSLKIFPVTLMEGNFMNDKNLPKEKVMENIVNLINAVKNVNGTFISIWHNHTVSETKEYQDWKKIHDQMIQKIVTISVDP